MSSISDVLKARIAAHNEIREMINLALKTFKDSPEISMQDFKVLADLNHRETVIALELCGRLGHKEPLIKADRIKVDGNADDDVGCA